MNYLEKARDVVGLWGLSHRSLKKIGGGNAGHNRGEKGGPCTGRCGGRKSPRKTTASRRQAPRPSFIDVLAVRERKNNS